MAEKLTVESEGTQTPPVSSSLLSRIPAWVYAFTAVALAGAFAWSKALALGNGAIGYALDDAYIHMAIAKNFAFHGVWGVTPYQPVSASSSPGWVLILTLCFKILGNRDWIPLGLNILAGVGVAYVVDRIVRPYVRTLWWRVVLLTGILFAIPLSYFISLGMEHTFQLLLIALFFGAARKIATPGYKLTVREAFLLFALCALMVSVRVEDAVLIPAPFVYALFKRDARTAAALICGPMAALALFALIAHSQGFPLEPTSMMVKRVHVGHYTFLGSNVPAASQGTLSFYLRTFWDDIALYREILFFSGAVLMMLIILLAKPRGRGSSILLLATVCTGFAIHALNGGFGWYWRYEGYLLVFAMLATVAICANAIAELRSKKPSDGSPAPTDFAWFRSNAMLALAAIGVVCLGVRAADAFSTNSAMMRDVGWQQMQVGRFIARFYSGKNVLLNDIGAPTYLADFHLTDVAGLGSLQVAQARLNESFGAEFVSEAIQRNNVELAVVHVRLTPSGPQVSDLPTSPTVHYPLAPVAIWILPKGSVLGGNIMFLAGSPSEADLLATQLHEYQNDKLLPEGVKAIYAHP